MWGNVNISGDRLCGQTLRNVHVTYIPFRGNICLELLPPRPGAADLELPSWSILCFPFVASDRKGRVFRGQQEGQASVMPIHPPSPPACFHRWHPPSFHPTSRSILLSFMSHSSFYNAWWMFPSVEFSKQTLFYLTSGLLRLGSLPPGREFVLASHHQGAAGRKFALCFSKF